MLSTAYVYHQHGNEAENKINRKIFQQIHCTLNEDLMLSFH